MANPATGCRCGSGGHPRRCEIHPFSFDEHVAEMNFWDALHDDAPDEPWPEHMAEVRRRFDVWEKASLAVLEHRNQEEDRLRAALAERDARIEKMEALFQQAHGVHHSWVQRALHLAQQDSTLRDAIAERDARIAELEKVLAPFAAQAFETGGLAPPTMYVNAKKALSRKGTL